MEEIAQGDLIKCIDKDNLLEKQLISLNEVCIIKDFSIRQK